MEKRIATNLLHEFGKIHPTMTRKKVSMLQTLPCSYQGIKASQNGVADTSDSVHSESENKVNFRGVGDRIIENALKSALFSIIHTKAPKM
jgi:hypothetical protein